MTRRFVVFASLSALAVGATFAWLAAADDRTVFRIVLACLTGAFCGVVAAGLIALVVWFVRRVRAGSPAPVSLLLGEERVLARRASHLTRDATRGGKLLVTNRRIVFQPHRFNAETEPLVLALAEIDEVRVAPEQLALLVRGEVVRLLVTMNSDQELESLAARIASMVQASRS